MNKHLTRCTWCLKDDQEMFYHDTEWGVPVHDDDKHFEFIVLDTFQAGLSWRTILHKRENFRKARLINLITLRLRSIMKRKFRSCYKMKVSFAIS